MMKNNSKQEIEKRVEQFQSVCRKNGVKLTHQRLEIFKEIVAAKDHPNAETLFKKVKKRLPTVSLDTVYRTLWLLSDLGLITKLGTNQESTRFDANLQKHHHFICSKCGYTRDFYANELNELVLPEEVNNFGEVIETHVEVRGICRDCAKQFT